MPTVSLQKRTYRSSIRSSLSLCSSRILHSTTTNDLLLVADSDSDSDNELIDAEKGGSSSEEEDSDASSDEDEGEEEESGFVHKIFDNTVLPVYDTAINRVALPIMNRITQTSVAMWATAILNCIHESATGRGNEGRSLLHGTRAGRGGHLPPTPFPPKVRPARAGAKRQQQLHYCDVPRAYRLSET